MDGMYANFAGAKVCQMLMYYVYTPRFGKLWPNAMDGVNAHNAGAVIGELKPKSQF
jgi:hypothetical protein